ncbi:ankyrin repeat and LEM domain-containing protein 2 homolog isoform X2 [Daktulosphaira vitifoliae]|uniref:ankyrin repeat and LEM domain-containing protein 2 homolog isoform X2 n=1 Tax=Daktulosphaira vitifoliae TaxID=58002 RepID=UPI0021A97DFC|nr:ankyrin repeat and LEM domain-containing protein 2 homolog isoform X2 [Daktulosphaira vitifoliae]
MDSISNDDSTNYQSPNCNQTDITKDGSFYGVFVETDKDESGTPKVFSKLQETLSAVKSNKAARFKVFRSASEAEHFSIFGQESPIKLSEKIYVPAIPTSLGFKSLKSEELVAFRRLIENGDVDKVKQAVNSNPKFLVSSGDTPSIIQEGCRYNPIHVAARYNQAAIIHFIMECITSQDFIKLLYGIEQSYLSRSEIIADLYLNTPDKASNDTPLHIASKFGHIEVVKELVSYDKCSLSSKNKYGQTPKDVICSRGNYQFYNEILNLLEDVFFVPMWKSDDNCIQPTIGKPFSPKSSPIISITQFENVDFKKLSPKLEIKAIAGPMNEVEAQQFWKDWKSPVRKSLLSPSPVKKRNSPRLRELQEKSFEKAGRELAEIKNIGWAEYWSFLDRIVDLRTERGLQLLEKYLGERFSSKELELSEKLTAIESTVLLSPMGELCKALESMRIGSNQKGKSPRRSTLVSYTCLVKSCKVLSERLSKFIISEYVNKHNIESMANRLCHEVRHLLVLEDSFYSDTRFDQNIQGKIHGRVAMNLCQILKSNSEFSLHFHSVLILLQKYFLSFEKIKTRSENTVACLTNLMTVIYNNINSSNCAQSTDSEEDCKKIFFTINPCSCSIELKSRLKPKQLFTDDEDKNDSSKIKVTEEHSSDDEIYISAPSSPQNESSDDEMFLNAEQNFSYLLFSRNCPTNDDLLVYDVLKGTKLDANKYPWLYRWLYSMDDYNNNL